MALGCCQAALTDPQMSGGECETKDACDGHPLPQGENKTISEPAASLHPTAWQPQVAVTHASTAPSVASLHGSISFSSSFHQLISHHQLWFWYIKLFVVPTRFKNLQQQSFQSPGESAQPNAVVTKSILQADNSHPTSVGKYLACCAADGYKHVLRPPLMHSGPVWMIMFGLRLGEEKQSCAKEVRELPPRSEEVSCLEKVCKESRTAKSQQF
ncbi:hypothetical protein EYF80_003458 [Liparis tanakae]|uniref:Uncharacterized protein n=1 Tax=Liparis tanakae TaxID=230148 RepID=A0A4Z2J9K9_9TELE|nr:hypothetical protein EYF80_003458 [Liparis tanakae]